jgi:hypothetical protein
VCRIEDEPRSEIQNDHAHAALTDISRQLQWHGKKLNVLIFEHSSKLGKKKFSAWLEWIYAFGATNGVVFRDKHHAA